MRIQYVPIRTGCCHRLALRSVVTFLHTGGPLAEMGQVLARQRTYCPHCGAEARRADDARVVGIPDSMSHYVFAGVKALVSG